MPTASITGHTRLNPVAVHAFVVPIVRELPAPPVITSAAW